MLREQEPQCAKISVRMVCNFLCTVRRLLARNGLVEQKHLVQLYIYHLYCPSSNQWRVSGPPFLALNPLLFLLSLFQSLSKSTTQRDVRPDRFSAFWRRRAVIWQPPTKPAQIQISKYSTIQCMWECQGIYYCIVSTAEHPNGQAMSAKSIL